MMSPRLGLFVVLRMKLRVRINRQTSRVELQGEDPSLTGLRDLIKETLLSSHGLSDQTDFSLSLNGSEQLSDTGQTLSSCGIVSGDLICVVLPESAAATSAITSNTSNTSNASTSSSNTMSSSTKDQRNELNQQTAAMSSTQLGSSSSPAASSQAEQAGVSSDSWASVSSWEPMLCSEAEEGQAPLSLDLLYHSAQISSPADAVVAAGHLLMLETGFVPQGGELKPAEMPAGWRSAGGAYRLQYSHPLCENSLAMVVGVCMGPLLVINATLKVNESVDSVRKLCLNPSSYVTHEWPGESAAAAFKDLKKLSRIFKDQLAYPLIAAAREAMALPVAFGLAALPPELFLRVVRLLDVRSVVRLSAVCRRFNVSTADSTLWRHLYRRDFTVIDLCYQIQIPTDRETPTGRSFTNALINFAVIFVVFLIIAPSLRFTDTPMTSSTCPSPPLHLPWYHRGEYDQRPVLPPGLLPHFNPIGPPRPLSDLRRGRPTAGGRPADVRRGFI
ncbi:hypothetical protein L3Q82_009222 [Scortum barcoo]|uniref:Uncharacterized protein n=1 Tax=Scortum barcoo TaxID=214431 RepID=A0ACB8WFV8_9TELE|nr:hypothetical protein L3Q82_009222 [Scortum barcoo]